MSSRKKNVQDVLQEEMFRERAAVLARAGERLSEALEKLAKIENDIAAGMARRHCGGQKDGPAAPRDDRCRWTCDLNGKIRVYNKQLEQVRTCYYYLIVTREALGILHHQRLEEIYRIPRPKRLLPEKGEG